MKNNKNNITVLSNGIVRNSVTDIYFIGMASVEEDVNAKIVSGKIIVNNGHGILINVGISGRTDRYFLNVYYGVSMAVCLRR